MTLMRGWETFIFIKSRKNTPLSSFAISEQLTYILLPNILDTLTRELNYSCTYENNVEKHISRYGGRCLANY